MDCYHGLATLLDWLDIREKILKIMMGKMLLLFKFPYPGYKEGCPLQVELVYSCSVLELQLDCSTLYGLHAAREHCVRLCNYVSRYIFSITGSTS